MNKIHRKKGYVELSLLDSLPDQATGDLVIERAWLPMVIWDGVRVAVRSTEGITLMERFVIECLITLGRCQQEELLEIAAIPPELSNWILSSLIQKGLAEQDGEWFKANVSACTDALAHKCVTVQREEKRAFIWFPDTHEVVVLKDAGSILMELRHVQPEGTYPLPSEWHRTTRAAIIQDAKIHGRVYGEESMAIVDVLDGDTFEAKNCPAYQCRATLRYGGMGGWSLSVSGVRKRKHRTEQGNDRENGREVERVERMLPFPALPERANLWRNRMARAGEAVAKQLEQRLGMTTINIEQQLHCTVREDAARAIASERLLVNRVGLLVRLDGEIEYGVPLHLQSGHMDDATKSLFAIDKIVQRILAAPKAADAAIALLAGTEATASDVIERLWGLKLFRTVYDLREAGDFSELLCLIYRGKELMTAFSC